MDWIAGNSLYKFSPCMLHITNQKLTGSNYSKTPYVL